MTSAHGDSARDPAAERRFRRLLVVSAVLHAAIIASIAGPAGPQLAKPLQLTLAPPRPADPPAQPAQPAAAEVSRVPSRATMPTAVPIPQPQPPARERAIEPPPILAAAPGGAVPIDPPARAAPAVEPERPETPAPTARPRPDIAGLVADYGRMVSGLVGSHRQYPGIARIRGWQGTTLLEVRVDPDGRILGTRIAKSSGHDILDRQAEAMVRRAEPLPPLPSGVPNEPVLLQLPILFALVN